MDMLSQLFENKHFRSACIAAITVSILVLLYRYFAKDGLVNDRGFPDFWESNRLLDAYKQNQIPGMVAGNSGHREHLSNMGDVRLAESNRLAKILA